MLPKQGQQGVLTFGKQQEFGSENEEINSIINKVTKISFYEVTSVEPSKNEIDAFVKLYKRLEKFLLS